jgi:hypothetical protein
MGWLVAVTLRRDDDENAEASFRGEGRALHLFLGASSDRLSFADQAWLGGVEILGCGDNERLVQLRVRAGAFYKPLTIMIRYAWNIRLRV